MKFLVVDDDDFLRSVAKSMLLSLNVGTILEAPNGLQALDILRTQEAEPVDLVLCDLNMPEMDGMEFLRHLGEAQSDVSVVVISAHDDTLISTVRKMALAYGVRLLGAIQKPLSPEHLKNFISEHQSAKCKKTTHKPQTPHFTLDNILHAVEQKQFEPFYQPKVGFNDGCIKGMEALARWVHPEHGVISPYAFIETLEKSGNIEALTFLMLEKAAAACKLLHDQGRMISVSVNLSPDLLGDPTLADKITKVAHNAGIHPQHIILEVTESAAMTHVAQSLENLARLRMHGFGLSIDDYGTGFSNMQQITRIAFSELKIDQSFVRGCKDNEPLCVVVKSSIEMAHKLKIECTAEGVETHDDWSALRNMGCDTAQGYFIAKPMSLTSLIDFFSSYSPKTALT